jgi:hypothetical protein
MSSDAVAQADIWTGAPNDTEYDAVYAAVTATERGRWFLTEFANRNRYADTQLLIDALARIESAVHHDMPAVGGNGAAPPAADAAVAAIEPASAAAILDKDVVAEITDDDGSRADLFTMELAENRGFAEAVAAQASSLTLLTEQDEPVSEPHNQPASHTVIPPPDYTEASAPPPVQAQADHAPRWYIEPPDFVFQKADKSEVESADKPEQTPSPPPRPQLPSGPQDDPAELFEQPPRGSSITQVSGLPEAVPPQFRVAGAGASRTAMRPTLGESLMAMRGLSEEELIALFG